MQMLDFIEELQGFVDRFGKSFDTFQADKAYKNAVAMSSMQIGELKNSLSEEFLEKYDSYFEWDWLRRFRNQFAHAYASLDDSLIWGFAIRKAPELEEVINRILFEDRKQEK
jgi:uncharacterized protein with HEPN domain